MEANNNMTIIQSNIVKEPTAVFATVARNGHATPDGANISREFYVTGVKMWPGPVDQNWNAENPFVISNESVTDAYQGTMPGNILTACAAISVSWGKVAASNDASSNASGVVKEFNELNADGIRTTAFANVLTPVDEKYFLMFTIGSGVTEAAFDTSFSIAVEVRKSATSSASHIMWGELRIDGFGTASFSWS